MIGVVLHLEDFVGDGGEDFVDGVEVRGGHGEGVEVGHGEVAAGGCEGFPYAVGVSERKREMEGGGETYFTTWYREAAIFSLSAPK